VSSHPFISESFPRDRLKRFLSSPFLFYFRLACRCAKETSAKGRDYFGLQFYGECWSDVQAEKKFDRYRKSPDCMGYEYKRCNDEDDKECVGGGSKNYVYKVVEGKEKRHQQQ